MVPQSRVGEEEYDEMRDLLLLWHKDFTLTNVVCCRNQTLILHLFDQTGRFVVSNGKFSLDIAG
jgi:hypothetical protein